MSDDIVVRLPHSLGADGVKRRLQGALQEIQTSYGKILTLSQVEWAEHRVTFVASALGQTLRGAIDIAETYVELRVSLPFLLRAFAKRIASAVQDNGAKLLR